VFFFNINKTMQIMVIPDAYAHMDGHPVLTYSYTLYKSNPDLSNAQIVDTDALLMPDKRKHPDYLGTIVFDQSKKSLTYSNDGLNNLSSSEVYEIINRISHYRENPNLWRI